jgi:hypothetical protein
MTGARIAEVAVLVLLGVSLLTRISDHSGTPLRKTDRALVEIRAEEKLPGTETVDLKNGNLHLQIPIPATTKKQ